MYKSSYFCQTLCVRRIYYIIRIYTVFGGKSTVAVATSAATPRRLRDIIQYNIYVRYAYGTILILCFIRTSSSPSSRGSPRVRYTVVTYACVVRAPPPPRRVLYFMFTRGAYETAFKPKNCSARFRFPVSVGRGHYGPRHRRDV